MQHPAVMPALMKADRGFLFEHGHLASGKTLAQAPGGCQTDDSAADNCDALAHFGAIVLGCTNRTNSTSESTINPSSIIPSTTSAARAIFSGASTIEIMMGRSFEICRKCSRCVCPL